MNILSIETSCDETAVSIVEANGDFPHATYNVLGNALYSQIHIQREYGGVVPNIAKREHAKTLTKMLSGALTEANMLQREKNELTEGQNEQLHEILHREPGLTEELFTFLESHTKPKIDLIAVTSGPGLEPALWVGVNFARALSLAWDIPVVPTNHMEGHVLSSIFSGTVLPEIMFPALALLISGGHTELVLMKDWSRYEKVGETRDDAVGEAFDKVARMLGLPYPGGPEISKLAQSAREQELPQFTELPRPMLDSGDYDFSFSGLKTAVKYSIQNTELSDNDRAAVAREFENATTDVLLKKSKRVVDDFNIHTLIIGGGVSANTHIRDTFSSFFENEYPQLTLYLPDPSLSTDNSVMIALAGHAHMNAAKPCSELTIVADGNLSLSKE